MIEIKDDKLEDQINMSIKVKIKKMFLYTKIR